MNDFLIIELLSCRIQNDRDAFSKLQRIADIVKPILLQHEKRVHTDQDILYNVCEALTFTCGRDWVIKHLRDPLDWADEWGDEETMVLAAWLMCPKTVNKMLDQGVDINIRHEYLGSLMYAAAYNDDGDLADRLIEREMCLQYSEGAYGDPLQLAAYRGSSDVVESIVSTSGEQPLLANAYSLGYGPFGSPLGAAAATGHTYIIDELCFHLLSTQIVGPDSKTPLHYAARNGHLKAVKMLLGPDVELDLVDDDNNTALDLAAKEGHVEIVSTILDELLTPLMRSTLRNHISMSLQYAAWYGHKDVVEEIMEYAEVPPHTCNGHLPPAIFCAALRGHYDVVDFFLEYEDEIDFQHPTKDFSLLTRLARHDSVDMLKHIIASGRVNVNDLDDNGNGEAALHAACRWNRPKVVQALLELPELNPNIEDSEGDTALSIALDQEYDEIVNLLLADERVKA